MIVNVVEQGAAVVAAYLREKRDQAPESIRRDVPHIVAVSLIKALTYGQDTVSSADIGTVLAALDEVEQDPSRELEATVTAMRPDRDDQGDTEDVCHNREVTR